MKWFIAGFAAVAPLAWCAASEVWLPQYGTERRERDGAIRTVFNDLRAPTLFTAPAQHPTRYGWVRFGWLSTPTHYEDLVEEDRDQGRRHEGVITVETLVWSPLGLQLEGRLTSTDDADLTIANPSVKAVWYLAQERYASFALAGGYAFSVEDDDWERNRDSDGANGHWILELRGGGAVGLWALQGTATGQYSPKGTNQRDTVLRHEDGTRIPADEAWESRHIRLDLGLSATYRLTRLVRLGFEGQATLQNWEGENDEGHLTDWRLVGLGVLGCDFTATSQGLLGAGLEPTVLEDQDVEDAWVGMGRR